MSAESNIVHEVTNATSFGDILAWSFVVLRQDYAQCADDVRSDISAYRKVQKVLARAIRDDSGPPRRPVKDEPSLTVIRLNEYIRRGVSRVAAYVAIAEVDRLVSWRWGRDRLSNGLRIPRNRLFTTQVLVFERRSSIVSRLCGNPEDDPPPIDVLGAPRGPEDEARALTSHTVFSTPIGDYAVRFLAKGWDSKRQPYESILFVSDCLVSNSDELDWRPYGVGDLLRQAGTGSGRMKVLNRAERALQMGRGAPALTASVVVLPELMVDSFVLDETLKIANGVTVAVLGSRHTRDREDYVNQATAMYEGDAWKHNKVTAFQYSERVEPIQLSPRQLTFVDTPLGRICVLICKDFLSPLVLRILGECAPNMIVIPALTPNGLDHLFASHALELNTRTRSLVFVANTCVSIRANDPSRLGHVGFLFIPSRPAPTFVWYGCEWGCSPRSHLFATC